MKAIKQIGYETAKIATTYFYFVCVYSCASNLNKLHFLSMNDEFFNVLSESDTITLLEITPTYDVAAFTVLAADYGHDETQTTFDPEQIASSSQASVSEKMVVYESYGIFYCYSDFS